ncbi:hypothetical protein N7523_006872 [Penicillium sp. IBT 18751x]|nr:hypothetical protein N7523_006872 [Penicillium sp. IBT 18751x]
MLSHLQLWVELGLLISWTKTVQSSAVHAPHSPIYDSSSSGMTTCTSEQVHTWPTSPIYPSDPITVNSTTIVVPSSTSTSNVSITSTACFNSTVTTTIIVSIVSTDWSTTTCTTTTTTTDTTTDTVTDIIMDTITDTVTDTTTETTTDTITDTTTETTTDTTTVTTTDTVTTPTTITVAPNPCPTTCSMYVLMSDMKNNITPEKAY